MLLNRETNDSKNAPVRKATKDREFTEVLIQSYEKPILSIGSTKNLFVSRIFIPLAGPDYIVTGALVSVRAGPQIQCRAEFSRSRFNSKRLDPFVTDNLSGVNQASLNVLPL